MHANPDVHGADQHRCSEGSKGCAACDLVADWFFVLGTRMHDGAEDPAEDGPRSQDTQEGQDPGRAARLREIIHAHHRTSALLSWGVWPSDDTYGTGQHGCQWSTEGSLNPGLPRSAPVVPPQMLVGPDDNIVQALTPAGLRLAAPATATTFMLSRVTHGLLYINGVRSLNGPGEVEIVRLSLGGADLARNAGPFDSATFATQKCFCPVEWGCSDEVRITLRALTPGAQLNWVVFGTLLQSWNSCYPTLGTVEAHAAAVWGMVNGRDGCDRDNIEKWRRSLHPAPSSTRANRGMPRSAAAKALAARVRQFVDAA